MILPEQIKRELLRPFLCFLFNGKLPWWTVDYVIALVCLKYCRWHGSMLGCALKIKGRLTCARTDH
jgi:hypothetical protein